MLDDGHKIGEITRWLNGQGVRTKRGNPFGRSRVREMLDNPWYGGKVRVRRETPATPEELEGASTWERNHPEWELIDGNHEPLLPWGEFERISTKLKRPERRSATRPSEVALLSGVARCALCGQGIWHRRGEAAPLPLRPRAAPDRRVRRQPVRRGARRGGHRSAPRHAVRGPGRLDRERDRPTRLRAGWTGPRVGGPPRPASDAVA
jgi:hypothetical protein